jgi:hypothetical protein
MIIIVYGRCDANYVNDPSTFTMIHNNKIHIIQEAAAPREAIQPPAIIVIYHWQAALYRCVIISLSPPMSFYYVYGNELYHYC